MGVSMPLIIRLRYVGNVQGFGLSFIPDVWLKMGKGGGRILKGRFKRMGYIKQGSTPTADAFIGLHQKVLEVERKREISGKWRRKKSGARTLVKK